MIRMRRLPVPFVLALSLLIVAAAGAARVIAQDAGADDGITVAQAEKLAAGLRQGMSLDDVQRLLGKPEQTALQSDGTEPSQNSKGTLQWSYRWTNAGKSERLRVDFTAQHLEAYQVIGWHWLAH